MPHLTRSPLNKLPTRFLKFGLVGISGIFVNEFITTLALWGFHSLFVPQIRTNLAVSLGWGTSVLTNFLLNYHWTWKDRLKLGTQLKKQKFFKYFLTAMAALLVQLSVVNLLAYALGWAPVRILIYNLFGIGVGMVINFILADKWVFRS